MKPSASPECYDPGSLSVDHHGPLRRFPASQSKKPLQHKSRYESLVFRFRSAGMAPAHDCGTIFDRPRQERREHGLPES